jgi:hypothetical protein
MMGELRDIITRTCIVSTALKVLREEHRLNLYENSVLRRTFEYKREK